MADCVGGEYPLTAFSFRVSIGQTEIGFSKASGLQREVETQTYQEGGLNGYVHVLPAPCKAERVLRLERGVYQGQSCPFYLVGERLASSVQLEVLNSAGGIAKIYTLGGALVKKWEVSELDALQNNLLIDKFELCYETLEVANGSGQA